MICQHVVGVVRLVLLGFAAPRAHGWIPAHPGQNQCEPVFKSSSCRAAATALDDTGDSRSNGSSPMMMDRPSDKTPPKPSPQQPTPSSSQQQPQPQQPQQPVRIHDTIQNSALLTLLHQQAVQLAHEKERLAEQRQRALLTTRLELEARQRRRRQYAWRHRVLSATRGAWLQLVVGRRNSYSYQRLGQTWQWFRRGRRRRQRQQQQQQQQRQKKANEDRSMTDPGEDATTATTANPTLTVSSRNLQDYAATVAVQEAAEEWLQQSPPTTTTAEQQQQQQQGAQQNETAPLLLLDDESALLQNVSQRADYILSDLGMGL
eukprot:CAMPEP_0168728290 /NCGR_PEP_ID=MMETSP0724-20121128/5608_1 /TAXON_ID=265536 /ORGANISM="Amphiprora sp., Strain CCMP467" /LENGTH=317 /DNA_ID=CAMNT_0008775131 /DNA_START=284 /DNA_END=1237 /DNA_ORIENTATION=-